jgi:hypothetical protein
LLLSLFEVIVGVLNILRGSSGTVDAVLALNLGPVCSRILKARLDSRLIVKVQEEHLVASTAHAQGALSLRRLGWLLYEI